MKKNELVVKIRKDIGKIGSRYRKKYDMVIFDLNVCGTNEKILVNGIVLSARQKNEAISAIMNNARDTIIKVKIGVLNDPDCGIEEGWAIVCTENADIWAKLSKGKKASGLVLATQAQKGDPLRVLIKKNNWSLVQTRDLAVGWADNSSLNDDKKNGAKKNWMRVKRIKENETIEKYLSKNIQNKFISFLKKYLHSPYHLGGMTDKGIDCSGLAERFYSDIFGVLLPRHSTDQASCGIKVNLTDIQFGDLIFLRHKETNFPHIAIVVEKFDFHKRDRKKNDILVLNARREKGGVAIEELVDVFTFYKPISFCRIIKEK